ncbi:MBL fold metallo-hydrolase [Leptolyngbya sp. FACHB-541]|uniref:MBL fold metallo-hydrolase n=1 Tax=Leptolyngbya sp. FACHB-541 TaxID=2692810 RepID=UPI0016830AE2|nr:MBL fold metallo-hydrolase [Leptolyngbya sp. FACHB-541]MBD2000326.1 MBL fold metallo-hydrolase [Leptolyngbya sp. FACHB-541]
MSLSIRLVRAVIQAVQRSHFRTIVKTMAFLLIALILTLPMKSPTVNAAHEESTPNAGAYQFQVGSFKVATISDGLLTLPPLPTYAPTADPIEVERAMVERFWSPSDLSLYFNATYVDTGAHQVLIDTGAGIELGAGLAKLAQNLRSIGVQPRDIDTVIITHAHPDHIGGIVSPDGQLTFPNAQYYISATEWQFWTTPTIDLSLLIIPEAFKQGIVASAQKHLGAIANKVSQFQPNQEIVPGITAIAAPGHTPGQSALQIKSEASQLMVTADVFFNEAFDLEHPEWQTGFDFNPQQAAETRRRLLDQVIQDRTMVIAYHMPFPAVGHIRLRGDRYEWEPTLWQFEP